MARAQHAVLAAGHGTALFNATPTPIALERHRQAGEKPPGRRSNCPDHRNRSDLAAVNAKGQAVMNAAEIARALGGRKAGAWWSCRCPVHDDRNPSLGVRDGDRSVIVRCFAGCDSRDVIGALRARGLWERSVQGHHRSRRHWANPARRVAQVAQLSRHSPALDLWRRAVPASGTLVERYLQSRGFTGPIPYSIRFIPDLKHPSGTRHPAMIAAVARAPGRKVVAVHRIFLASDGTGKAAMDPNKMSLGPVGGGAVRLAPASEHLAVGEGIESSLSVMQVTGVPTWAALSAGGIKLLILPPLPLASVITITADNDPTGLAAARDAAERWTREGRRVRIALPPEGRDFNDLLRGAVS